ncbi:hypothetical protein M2451_002327 [Dysgonomonas sp. PFB1-18]|uniref:hypothetical protein n=1 Tax=unclassified Dysgonomonas TaxID=2630389 RepID=UPI002475F3E6|nr:MULTISPECIES: hypothetical protein [unclassified Dysgonomonas]MDH6307093.1 hypothetical protein [Dysgonomonas sp. PF1-14]MDH6337012.1 hypothetical protein [Dysgonomonas sp. PF1-16]MDH6380998.1 hypothetical protein [Dysgonomonas sp. PFB1-18]MDH6396423.1 hypothetical protein [Dysgonomonas sp. PF1-23]
MNIQNLKRWLAVPLLLGAILYACQSEDSPDIDTKQPVEPLTVAMAQSLYEQYVGATAYLKNDDGNGEFNLVPDWNAGQLFSDSNWYVVESPLEQRDGMKMIFMTQDVGEYAQQHENTQIEQILRLVVMRNKETGLNYSFIMLVMPELDYMYRKGAAIHENKYLTRETDLDGYVYFLTPEGSFVNAWKYKEGRIVGRTPLSTDKVTKGFIQVETCYWTLVTAGGNQYWNYHCEYYWLFVEENKDAPPAIDSGGPIDPGYDPMSGPGGGGIPTLDKEPEKRTDCTEKSRLNGKNTSNMLNDIDIKDKMNLLRTNANTSQKIEYGAGISYDSNFGTYSITGGQIAQGAAGSNSVEITYSAYTVYTAHTHYQGLNAASSGGDIITTAKFYKEIKAMGGDYKGTINFAADGSEYLIYVDDPVALEKFYNALPTNNDFFVAKTTELANGSDFKKDSEYQRIYIDVKRKLEKEGYSENEAQAYALSYVSDHYKMGLKISYRKNKNDNFKEQKTTTTGTGKSIKYKPQICPES